MTEPEIFTEKPTVIVSVHGIIDVDTSYHRAKSNVTHITSKSFHIIKDYPYSIRSTVFEEDEVSRTTILLVEDLVCQYLLERKQVPYKLNSAFITIVCELFEESLVMDFDDNGWKGIKLNLDRPTI